MHKNKRQNFGNSALVAITNFECILRMRISVIQKSKVATKFQEERGDVPGWVLVVLMTTGLVTAIWTIAAPRLTAILKNSLDSMNGIR
jgi:hypothetical protein